MCQKRALIQSSFINTSVHTVVAYTALHSHIKKEKTNKKIVACSLACILWETEKMNIIHIGFNSSTQCKVIIGLHQLDTTVITPFMRRPTGQDKNSTAVTIHLLKLFLKLKLWWRSSNLCSPLLKIFHSLHFRVSLKSDDLDKKSWPQTARHAWTVLGRADWGTHLHLADQITIFIDLFLNYIFSVLMLLADGIRTLCAPMLVVH